ncbi:MAG: TIGR03016 family PEP-CTERM system-associated outer membrane protein [Deltaproteobacteria bacterium]|nr:TIGR03016 family PEP-CTERM system-associated outer membrane protein [Deltaproteobacteria bacterium]
MKKKRLLTILLLLIPAFSLGYASSSWAEYSFTPNLVLREEYNDNIFLTRNNKEDDFISSITPSVKFSYKTSILTLSLDYGLHFRFFAHHPQRNETGLSKTQRAKLDTTLSPYKEIVFLKLFDEYTRVPVDQRNQVALDNIFVNLTDMNRLVINPYILYPVSSGFSTSVGYTYDNSWYRSHQGDNTENHTANLNLIKVLTDKITSTVTYSYLFHRPKITPKYDKQDVFLNLSYDVSAKLNLNGGAGRTWFNYMDRPSQNSSIWNAKASYHLTDLLSLGAGHTESFMDSVKQGTFKRRSTTGSIGYSGKLPVNLTVFSNIDTYDTVDRTDRSRGATLSTNMPITPKLTGGVTGTYSHFGFQPEGESMNRYSAAVSFAYAMKITTLSLGYTYNLNDSTNRSNNYDNNIVWLQAGFTI